MKRRVKIKFNVWDPTMDAQRFFHKMPYMLNSFDFVGSDNPDFLIFSPHRKKNNPRGNYTSIFYTAENVKPKMDQYDWALTFCYEDQINNPRHFRMPNYVRVGVRGNLIKKESYDSDSILENKRKFCAFVYWNNSSYRNKLFDLLSKYKRVDAPGRAKNNMPPIKASTLKASRFGKTKGLEYYDDKIDFFKDYKFVIACENEKTVGYTTEKLPHAMLGDSVPIYWGNPQVGIDFNRDSFIDANKFKAVEDLVDYIVAVDKDDSLYLKHLSAPWYNGNKLNPWVRKARMLSVFKTIFTHGK